MPFEMPWTRRRRERIEKDLRDREAQAYKLFEAGKSAPFVAAELRISAEDVKVLQEKFRTMRAPDDALLRTDAFAKFDDGKTQAQVAAALKIDMALVAKFYEEYATAKTAELKAKEALDIALQGRGGTGPGRTAPPIPPFRVRKLVINPQSGTRNSWFVWPSSFDVAPTTDQEIMDFAKEAGDGTYEVVDSKTKVIGRIQVYGMGYDDPLRNSANPKFGILDAKPKNDETDLGDLDKAAEQNVKRQERLMQLGEKEYKLWLDRGRPDMAEKVWRRLHPEDYADEALPPSPQAPGAPGVGGEGGQKLLTPEEAEEYALRRLERKWRFEETLREHYGGGGDGKEGSKERFAKTLQETVGLIVNEGIPGVTKMIREARGSTEEEGELDAAVMRNVGRRQPTGTPARRSRLSTGQDGWTRDRTIRPRPSPAADEEEAAPSEPPKSRRVRPALPPSPEEKAAAAEGQTAPKKKPGPTADELEKSLMELEVVADATVPPEAVELPKDAAEHDLPAVDLGSKNIQWFLNTGLPMIVKKLKAYQAKVAAGRADDAEELSGSAVAKDHFKMLTGPIGYGFVGAKGMRDIYRAVRHGYDDFVAMVEPEIQKQADELGEMADALVEVGKDEFLSRWEPPAGEDKAKAYQKIATFAKLRPLWKDLQSSPEATYWMRGYFEVMRAYIEEWAGKKGITAQVTDPPAPVVQAAAETVPAPAGGETPEPEEGEEAESEAPPADDQSEDAHGDDPSATEATK